MGGLDHYARTRKHAVAARHMEARHMEARQRDQGAEVAHEGALGHVRERGARPRLTM